MKKQFRIVPILSVLLILTALFPTGMSAQSIKVTGSWDETIDSTDLQGGAGTDLIGTYESVSNVCDIDVTSAKKNWRVDVSKTDTLWHANLRLYVRRTSDGTGKGTISGGMAYQEITDVNQTFFSGYDNLRNITIQYQLTGVSVQILPSVYTTTVNYTITRI